VTGRGLAARERWTVEEEGAGSRSDAVPPRDES
jgi:hypothetical protein